MSRFRMWRAPLLASMLVCSAALTGATGVRAAGPAGTWFEFGPTPRQGQSVVFDAPRNRIIVFGGEDAGGFRNDVWSLSLDGAVEWTRLAPPGPLPMARTQHSAIYDPVQSRMILFGGRGVAGLMNDTWQLSLSGPPVWTQLDPSGVLPTGRHSHAAVYDSRRHLMIVHGGVDGFSARNEIYLLSLEGLLHWSLKAQPVTTPPGRRNHVAIYDLAGDRLVISGGYALGDSADTWALPMEGQPVWKRLAMSGAVPAGRERHSAYYDDAARRLVIFGGRSGSTTLGDLWALPLTDGATWESLAASAPPTEPRHSHGAAYEPASKRWIVIGGMVGGSPRSDVLALATEAPKAWTTLQPGDSLPAPRQGAAVTLDAVSGRVLVFGGNVGAANPASDLWSYSLPGPDGWSPLTPQGPGPVARQHAAIVTDAARSRAILMGGNDGTAFAFDDLWELSLAGAPAWTALTPLGVAPDARSGHALLLDSTRDRLLMFGGRDGAGVARADVWELPLSGPLQWAPIAVGGTTPAARDRFAAGYDAAHDQLVIFGGRDDGGVALADAWTLALSGTPEWTQMQPAGTAPSARYSPAFAFDSARDRLLLFGGGDPLGSMSDLWELSLSGAGQWSALVPSGPIPDTRRESTAMFDVAGDRLLMYGGFGDASRRGDLWKLSFSGVLDAGGQELPVGSALRALAPNPSRGTTTIRWAMARAGHASVRVFDLSGRQVRTLADREFAAGEHTSEWDGRDDAHASLGAGIYFVRLSAPGVDEARKVVRVR